MIIMGSVGAGTDVNRRAYAVTIRSPLLSNPTTAQYLAHGGTLPQLTQVVNTQALVLAFADVNYALMGIALLCIPLVFLMRKPKASAGAVVEIGG
jgi:hypothetical protein